MYFNLINKEKWDRKSYFEHYLNIVRCTYNMTINIDVTDLLSETRQKHIKLYPTMIYMISKIVNNHSEFRTSYDKNGNLGYWDIINPSYTVFHKENETFSCLWTEYNGNFERFYSSYIEDIKCYGNEMQFNPKINEPVNLFSISCIPWASFTGFNLNIYTDGTYLLPIFTIGKYFEQDKKILLPVSVQVHHAVCDGYHTSRLFNEIQEMAYNYKGWLKKIENTES